MKEELYATYLKDTTNAISLGDIVRKGEIYYKVTGSENVDIVDVVQAIYITCPKKEIVPGDYYVEKIGLPKSFLVHRATKESLAGWKKNDLDAFERRCSKIVETNDKEVIVNIRNKRLFDGTLEFMLCREAVQKKAFEYGFFSIISSTSEIGEPNVNVLAKKKYLELTFDQVKEISSNFKRDTEIASNTEFAKKYKHDKTYAEMEEIWWEEFYGRKFKM